VFFLKGLTLLDSQKFKHVHFIGIGGSSMSGLAEILLSMGYKVSGSDKNASYITEKLRKMGAEVYPFHSEENVVGADLVVYTVAVKDDNPELVKARSLGIPVIDRAALLGEIMKAYPYSVAVSGTHGKTTTSSMITTIMMKSGLNPTVQIGGELDSIGGNIRLGGDRYFVAEACEYYESFLKFHPYLAVVLNIELDHVDYFRDIEHIKSAFLKFMSSIPENGYVVACSDDANVRSLLGRINCNIVTYGIRSRNAMWRAKGIKYDERGCASYTLVQDGKEIDRIKLGVPGIHNVSNSLAAIASCYSLGCRMESIKEGLAAFSGTHRRFETKGIVKGIRVIDDYAHHPSEVRATLQAAKNCKAAKVWCVFQPHTYSRLQHLLEDFSTAFNDADSVIVSDIYAARETNDGSVHAGMLVDKLKEHHQDVLYLSSFETIVDYLSANASPGDIIITMGAGDIYKVGEMFLSRNKDARAVGI